MTDIINLPFQAGSTIVCSFTPFCLLTKLSFVAPTSSSASESEGRYGKHLNRTAMFRGSRGFGPIKNADSVVKSNLTSWLASANATFETETTKCGGLFVVP
jgi:hypothetical protein